MLIKSISERTAENLERSRADFVSVSKSVLIQGYYHSCKEHITETLHAWRIPT